MIRIRLLLLSAVGFLLGTIALAQQPFFFPPVGYTSASGACTSTQTWTRVNGNITRSNGNLTATQTSADGTYSPGYGGVSHTTGKYYWEIIPAFSTSGDYAVGIGLTTSSTANGQWLGIGADTLGWYSTSPNGPIYHSGLVYANAANWANGDRVGLALDLVNGKMWSIDWSHGTPTWNNNTVSNPTNPANNTGGITLPSGVVGGSIVPAFSTFHTTVPDSVTAFFSSSGWIGIVPTGFGCW